MECPTIGGESPVGESYLSSWKILPSSAGHVESCVNLGGPSSKAKYVLMTDSELVP